jgi:D-amino-acid dehydrogenase
LGNRVRVSTGAELGVPLSKIRQSSVKKMFDTLLQYFPGAAKLSSGTQIWKGASGLSNDGAPYIGPTHAAGVWVNTGHGPNGWGMACGAARLVADAIGKKDTLVDASLFSPQRL